MDHRQQQPAYALHAAVTHLDAAAERMLRERFDIGYPRFLLLVTVDRVGPCTQRVIAAEMVTTEPTASRSVAAAQRDGHLTVERVPGGGNRRVVALTPEGRRLVSESLDHLEGAFGQLLDVAGMSADEVLDVAGRLLAVLAPQSAAALATQAAR